MKKLIKLGCICIIASILFTGCSKNEEEITVEKGYVVQNEEMYELGRDSYNKSKDDTELWIQQTSVVDMLGDQIKETASEKNRPESDIADYYYGIIEMIAFYTDVNLSELRNNDRDEEAKYEEKILAFIKEIMKNYSCDYSISDEKREEYLSWINSKTALLNDNNSEDTFEEENINLTMKYGSFEQAIVSDGILIVKAKITPSYDNNATIIQNSYNVEDIIKNQGGDKYKEIQYWAIADMEDGSESKVISFTVDKDTIDGVVDGRIIGNEIIDYSKDVWILPSLRN